MSWGSLQALLAEARTHRRPAGTECPNDGTPLVSWRGQLRCPFDGWSGTAAQAEPRGPALASADPYPGVGDPYLPTYASTY